MTKCQFVKTYWSCQQFFFLHFPDLRMFNPQDPEDRGTRILRKLAPNYPSTPHDIQKDLYIHG
jgi:hypothetical protein